MMQIGFVTELFEAAKGRGIHTCLDTSGATFRPNDERCVRETDRLLAATDLVMLDIKHIDPEGHTKLCGRSNENILAFARHLDRLGKEL